MALLLAGCLFACAPDTPPQSVTDGEARSADGVAIRYDSRGFDDPALVLVHGWANTRAIWGVHPETISLRHRVVALDLAGHGTSGADRADWTMGAFGEDVVAVVDQLGLERVVLVGFSMGGAVVLEAAKRLGDRVLGVVFVDVFHDPDAVVGDAEKEQVATMMRTNWRDTAFIRAFAFTPDAPDSLLTYVREMMPEQPHEHYFTALESLFDWIGSELRPTLRNLDRPLAAINTTVPPTNVEAMRRYVHSFTVDTIDGVGHGGILLRRVEDFDARLLAIVERFAAMESEGGNGRAATSPYLFVWAGAEDEADSDFLAVIDADPESGRYGEILSSELVGLKGGAHHSEHVMPEGDTLFVNSFQAGTSFLMDVSDPLDPWVAGTFREMGEYTYPHTFERLPNGNVLAAFQTMGEGNEIAGGLVELDPSGAFVRASAATDPVDPELRAYSVTPIPRIDRAVSTTSDMWEKAAGTSFQVWRLSDLELLKTVRLPEGPLGYEHRDPAEVRLLPDSATAIMTTFTCAMYLLHGIDTDEPWAELVNVLAWDDYPYHCGIPLTRGRYWVQTYAHADGSALISLDISDPSNPVEVHRLTLGEEWAPHWISMEPSGDRIVVTSAPGSTLYRVLIARLDPETGTLALDSTFRSPGADVPGVSFNRTSWPHGEAGPARPHGAVFSRK